MSQSNQKGNIPSTESLSISASIFLSSIDSWIPPTFGTVTTKSHTNGQSEENSNSLLLRPNGVNETNDRLGLGHPSYNQPSNQRTIQRNGLIGLHKKLNLEKKNQINNEKDNVGGISYGEDQDSDDEESRVRSLAKKKNTFVDPFGGKSKKKKKDPFAVGNSNPKKHNSPVASRIQNEQDQNQGSEDEHHVAGPSRTKQVNEGDVDQINHEDQDELPFPSASASTSRPTTPPPASSPDGSGSFPYDGPRPFGSPNKSKSKVNLVNGKGKGKRLADDDDMEVQEEAQGEVQGNSLRIGITDHQDKQSNISSDKPIDATNKPDLEEPKSKTKIRRENRKRARLLKSQ